MKIEIKSNINIFTSFGNVVKGQKGYIFEHFLNQKRVFYPVEFETVIDGVGCLGNPYYPDILLTKADFTVISNCS